MLIFIEIDLTFFFYQNLPNKAKDLIDAKIDYFNQVWLLHQLVSKENQFCFWNITQVILC